jgi:hypothetical protein
MDSLARERDQRMQAIQLRRGESVTGKFVEQAYQLLTGLFWSRANCNQRSHLLKVADWLIELQERSAARSGVPVVSSDASRVGRRQSDGGPANRG